MLVSNKIQFLSLLVFCSLISGKSSKHGKIQVRKYKIQPYEVISLKPVSERN